MISVRPNPQACEGRFALFRYGYDEPLAPRSTLIVFVSALLLSSILHAQAQRRFSLILIPTAQNDVILRWKAQSATPTNSLILVPQFVVQRSHDLKSWTSISAKLTASAGQTLSLVDSSTNLAFYRVQSLIEKEYAELSGAKLTGGELDGADFFGAKLFSVSLDQAVLAGASLSGTDLRSANLQLSDLRGANLFGVEAFGATFDNSDLKGVDARFGNFETASFFAANLEGADFGFTILSRANFDYAWFKQVKLDTNTLVDAKPKLIWQLVNNGAPGALLTNLDLSLASLMGVNFQGAKFNGSDLSGSDLRNADVRRANFTLANLRFVDFHGTLMDLNTIIDSKPRLVWRILNEPAEGRDLHGTNLGSVWLVGANLISANLSNAVCTVSIFDQANFGGAKLVNANCSSSFFVSAILTNANLTQAQFQSTDLTRANFRNAITNGANFSGAIFRQTIMPDGSIKNP